jgi:outer membrane murein-binding lipoprotein Lpp
VNKRQLIAIVSAVVSFATFAGCASDEPSSREDRASSAVQECRGHGGVGAFEDDVVICRDQTTNEDRGARAVAACRGHGGVVAFDDDIVFCRDQTFQEAEER